MSGREEMLARIRKALGGPAQAPTQIPQSQARPPDLGGVMPAIAPEELVPKFEAEFEKLAGSAHRAATFCELEKVVQAILEASHAQSVVLSRNPLLAHLGLEGRLRAWGQSVAVWPTASNTPSAVDRSTALRAFAAASFSATVGITGVDFVLAETGSIVLSSLTEGSQLASLTPPIHVALYRRSQVLESLDDVLEKLPVSRDPNLPSLGRSVVFITGPSRTADIEQILIRGVHGPREVHAILLEEACLSEVTAT